MEKAIEAAAENQFVGPVTEKLCYVFDLCIQIA